MGCLLKLESKAEKKLMGTSSMADDVKVILNLDDILKLRSCIKFGASFVAQLSQISNHNYLQQIVC